MSPYRNPEPPAPDVESRAFRFRRWAGEHEVWLIIGATGALVVLVGAAAWHDRQHPPPPRPCSSFADTPAKDLPARCTKTYAPEAP